MVNTTLSDYITQERAKGFSDEKIKEVLIQHGWNITIVNEAINKNVKTSFFSKKLMISLVLISFIILICFGLIVGRNLLLGSSTKIQSGISNKKSSDFAIIDNSLNFTNNLSINRGGALIINISFFNEKNEFLENIEPTLSNCTDQFGKQNFGISFESIPSNVAPNSKMSFESLIRIKDVFEGKYTCDLSVIDILRKIEINVI